MKSFSRLPNCASYAYMFWLFPKKSIPRTMLNFLKHIIFIVIQMLYSVGNTIYYQPTKIENRNITNKEKPIKANVEIMFVVERLSAKCGLAAYWSHQRNFPSLIDMMMRFSCEKNIVLFCISNYLNDCFSEKKCSAHVPKKFEAFKETIEKI